MKRLTAVLVWLMVLAIPFLPARAAQFVAEDVAAKCRDSVVTLEAVSLKYAAGRLTSRQQRILRSYSTAVILSKDGYLLASEPSLRDVELVEARTAEGSRYPADVLVRDEAYGLALLKMQDPPPDLKPVKFGDPSGIRQGESVVVIGSAGGLGHTVSYGIISARRSVRLRSGQLVTGMIQSDVILNTGNLGSPLFNAKGEMVGVHAVFGTGQYGRLQNITFFMPLDLVKRVYNELMETREPAFRPFLGIEPWSSLIFEGGTVVALPGARAVALRELTDDLRMYMDLPDQYWDVGVLIYNVWEGSPAYDAGLRYQDFIIKLDGELLKTIGQLEEAVYYAKKDQKMVFTVIRRHRIQEFEVVVGNHPKETLGTYI